ncbi:MAG TPA: hypothetical protein VMH28_08915 [Candidatus Acidoferrales bacterium]|nr:hypothetical protein [Candidatus Acidoferrales bacterium]
MFRHIARLILVVSCLAAVTAWAQGRGGGPPQTPPPNASTDPLLRGFEFRSVGPATMMGRVDDIQGSEKDPMIVYLGFATGGLWKSTDGGNHWKSLFDNLPNASIGSIGVAPSDPNVVYVGMGEGNNRQSSSIGDGVWGTRDGGEHWTHLGLDDTQSIQRVAVDPSNPNICYVAAGGHLFGPNPDRGLYKTSDGGKTWNKVKFIDNDTGFTDVAIDPSNPKIVYAASYSRRRTWWGFNGGGPNSALWKTADAGATWTKLDGQGWPKAKDGIYGRIAIAVYKAKPSIVYAQVEVGASGGTGGGTDANGGPARGGRGGFGGGESATETAPTNAPAGTPGPGAEGGGGGRGGRGGPPAPPDPNASGVFRSEDGGKTWTFMSNQNQRPMYFSQIRVDPTNDKKIFVGGNPGQISLDGGKTWAGIAGSHTDYHAFWINPKDPRVVYVGHDGGMDLSFDGGVTWDFHNDIAVGQFYQVSADMRRPYYVCGGLQDNNAWCGPSAMRSTTGPVNTDWFTVAGGDGFYTRQDPTDWAIVYAESQDGNMVRHDLRNGTQKNIRPNAGQAGRGAAGQAGGQPPAAATETPTPAIPPAGGEQAGGRGAAAGGGGGGFGGRGGPPNVVNAPPNPEALRFYWNAPIEISPHNPAVVYMAAQYFFKSTNRGDTWWMNKADLSKNVNRWAPEQAIMGVAGDKPMASKHDGYAASSLATQVRESPSRPGVIWVGTDDGNLQLSRDGGETFSNVYDNISGAPKGYVQISRIEPSHFDPGTTYVALDNHRNDDWRPYLFRTADYGRTWTNVTGNLPAQGNINALREDYDNPNLLFAGTEFGLYVTLDGGKEWKKFMTGLPSVRVDDILIHPRDRDLIIATHGRSIWICDDITPLEQLKATTDGDLALFDPRPVVLWKNDPQAQRHATNRDFKGQNPQGGTAISILAKSAVGSGKVEFLQNNNVMSSMDVDIKEGMNRFQWGVRGLPTATATAGTGRGGRRGGAAAENNPQAPAASTQAAAQGGGRGGRGGGGGGVPFVLSGRGGFGGGGGGGGANVFTGQQPPPAAAEAAGGRGGGGGFGFGAAAQPPILEPGTYMVRLTAGGKTLTSSVVVLEDIWMRPQ